MPPRKNIFTAGMLNGKSIHFCLLFLFLLLTTISASAQRKYRPGIRETVSSGFFLKTHLVQLKEGVFSPLRYHGPSAEINYVTLRYPGDFRRSLEIGAQSGYLINRLELGGWHLAPHLSMSYSYNIEGASSGDLNTFLGARLSGNSRMVFFTGEDPHHLYWVTAYTLGLICVADIELTRDRMMFFEISIPLAGAVSRPPGGERSSYQVMERGSIIKRLHEDPVFSTFDNLQAANIKLMVDISRTNRGSLTLGYEADFLRFAGPEPVTYLNNGLFLRVFFDSHIW